MLGNLLWNPFTIFLIVELLLCQEIYPLVLRPCAYPLFLDLDFYCFELYSRQLYVLGHDAMHIMARSHVHFCGRNGLGVESARNVVLEGVKSESVYDRTPATLVVIS